VKTPRDSFEHEWDVPKLNNFVAELELKVHGQFFCTESRGTGVLYLDLVQGWLMPQLQEYINLVVLYKETASLHSLMKGGRTYTNFS